MDRKMQTDHRVDTNKSYDADGLEHMANADLPENAANPANAAHPEKAALQQETSPRELLIRRLILAAGAIGISMSAVFIRYSDCPVLVLVLYRMVLTALMLCVPAVHQLYRDRKSIHIKDIVYCVIGGIFLAAHFTCYFSAVRNTTVAAAVLLSDTEIFFVTAVSLLIFKEKFSRRALAGMLLSFVGCAMIILCDKGGTGSLRGDIYALMAAATMAVYTLMGRLARRSMGTSAYTFVVYSVTALTALMILKMSHVPVLGYSSSNLIAAAGMAVFCTLLGHNIYNWALKYFSAATVSTSKLLEPVVSAILAVFLYGEIQAPLAIVGGVAVLIGVYRTITATS